MAAPHRRQDDDDQNPEEPEQVVEADTPLSPEEKLVAQGVNDISAGEEEEEIAAKLRKAARILEGLGKRSTATAMIADAKKYGDRAKSDVERGVNELHQAEDVRHQQVVEQLAVQIVDAPGSVANWRTAVAGITQVVRRQITEEEFLLAAGGDKIGAEQLQSEILSKGDEINRSLSHGVQNARQAANVVVIIFEFVSAVLTVYDHVPEPVKQMLWQGLRVLAPFLPA